MAIRVEPRGSAFQFAKTMQGGWGGVCQPTTQYNLAQPIKSTFLKIFFLFLTTFQLFMGLVVCQPTNQSFVSSLEGLEHANPPLFKFFFIVFLL